MMTGGMKDEAWDFIRLLTCDEEYTDPVLDWSVLNGKSLDLTFVCLFLFIIINAHKQQVAAVVGQTVKVFPVLYLADGAFGGIVALELYDYSRNVRDIGDENDIGKAFTCCHLLYYCIFIQGINVRQIYGTLKDILIVIAAV